MKNCGIIYQGEPRTSTKQKKQKEGDYKEFPFYLTKNIENLKFMIAQLAKTNRLFDSYFILELVENSKYIKSMKEEFGDEVRESVVSELRENYSPYKDPFYKTIVQPQLVEQPWHCLSVDAEGVLWRLECLRIEARCNSEAPED